MLKEEILDPCVDDDDDELELEDEEDPEHSEEQR